MTAPSLAQSKLYDVQGSWNQKCIEDLEQRNVISGYPDGSFRPNSHITRGEFAAIINKAFPNATATREPLQFIDVPASYWGYNAIREASQLKFLSGYPGNVFKPNQNIPRVQALVALASGLNFYSTKVVSTGLNTAFDDANKIPNYARSKIAAVTERQLVVNYPNVSLLRPNELANRAEVAAFFCQALVGLDQASLVPSQYIVGIASAQPSPTAVGTTSASAQPSPTAVGTTSASAQPSPILVRTTGASAQPSPILVRTTGASAQPSPILVRTTGASAQPSPIPVVTTGAIAQPSPIPVVTTGAIAQPSPIPVVTTSSDIFYPLYLQDFRSWNGVTYGMSAAALKGIFGDRLTLSPVSDWECFRSGGLNCKGTTQWIMKNFNINERPYNVTFQIENNKLTAVFIQKYLDSYNDFLKFKYLLETKYGPPTITDTNLVKIGLIKYIWQIPNTKVYLNGIVINEKNTSMGLFYLPR